METLSGVWRLFTGVQRSVWSEELDAFHGATQSTQFIQKWSKLLYSYPNADGKLVEICTQKMAFSHF